MYAFAVKDDGPGIPAQFHDQVFKMFQTLKPRDRVEGSGIEHGARQLQEIWPSRGDSDQCTRRSRQPSCERSGYRPKMQREHVGAFWQRLPHGGAIRKYDRNGAVQTLRAVL